MASSPLSVRVLVAESAPPAVPLYEAILPRGSVLVQTCPYVASAAGWAWRDRVRIESEPTPGTPPPVLTLVLPVPHAPVDGPWQVDELEFALAVALPALAAGPAAWHACWARVAQGQQPTEANVAFCFRLHRLADYLGCEALMAAVEHLLAGVWLDALVLAPAAQPYVKSLLLGCTSDMEARGRLFLTVVAWAAAAQISVRARGCAASPAELRQDMRLYLESELGVDTRALAIFDHEQTCLSTVCPTCARNSPVASQARRGSLQWPATGPAVPVLRTAPAGDAMDTEEEEVDVASLDRRRGFCHGAPPVLPMPGSAGSPLYSGHCASCGNLGPLLIHWVRPRARAVAA